MKEYQFCVQVSFDIEVDFSRDQVQQWTGGLEGELEPKDEVMEQIEARLTQAIGQEFRLLSRVNLYTDGELMKGHLCPEFQREIAEAMEKLRKSE